MNPLAQQLNEQIRTNNPHVLEMLSPLGRRLFFPKGILSQSAEAKEKAFRFNATIGIALEKGEAMHLACIQDMVKGLRPDDVFPYAPAAGKPALRDKWQRKATRREPFPAGQADRQADRNQRPDPRPHPRGGPVRRGRGHGSAAGQVLGKLPHDPRGPKAGPNRHLPVLRRLRGIRRAGARKRDRGAGSRGKEAHRTSQLPEQPHRVFDHP